MELVTRESPCKRYGGSAEMVIAARKPLNIRYKDAGDWVDVLNVDVPAGKTWAVTLTVSIVETDA